MAELAALVGSKLLRGAVEVQFFSTDINSPMISLHIGVEKLVGIFCCGCFRLQYAVSCRLKVFQDFSISNFIF